MCKSFCKQINWDLVIAALCETADMVQYIDTARARAGVGVNDKESVSCAIKRALQSL